MHKMVAIFSISGIIEKIKKGKRKMSKGKIAQAIDVILAQGTQIVSFDYDGKRRNVLVGSNEGLKKPAWGRVVNRAMRQQGNKNYLVGRVQNEGEGKVYKTFSFAKIRNPSFV